MMRSLIMRSFAALRIGSKKIRDQDWLKEEMSG
jgi:hypothetical protein